MRNTIKQHSPYIIIGVEGYTLKRFGHSSKELFDMFRSLDYYILLIDYKYPSDHLCIPNSKKQEFLKEFSQYITKNEKSNHINNNLENGVNYKISM